MLPDGWNSGEKAKAGLGGSKVGWKNSRPNFLQNFTWSGRKGAKQIFLWSSLFYINDKHSDKEKIQFSFLIDPSDERCIDVFVKLAELLLKWPYFFDVLTGKQFCDLATVRQFHCVWVSAFRLLHSRSQSNPYSSLHLQSTCKWPWSLLYKRFHPIH